MTDKRQTKWSILVDRQVHGQALIDDLIEQLAKDKAYLEGLEQTPCNLICDCGEVLATEADFAKHFTVPDRRYLNLGSCPVKDALTGDPWTPAKLDRK